MRSWLSRAALPLALIVVAVAALTVGCSGIGQPTQQGNADTYLSFTVAWPQHEANAELIPSGADRIEVTIANTGDETPEAVVVIARSEAVAGTATKLVPVEASPSKEIAAQALAADGSILAEAAVSIEVTAGQRTPVALNLSPTSLAYPIIVLATATPAIALPGESVTLQGDASDGDGGTIAELAWDTDGNGGFDYTSATDGTTTIAPADGIYTAVFRATDEDGLSSSVSVGYQVGVRNPAWSTTPPSVDMNRKQPSAEQQLEYIPGFPASPCHVNVVGGEFLWTTTSEVAGDPTVLRGTFAATDNQWVGTTTADVFLEDDIGRTSDPVQIRFTVKQGFHGFVSDLITPTAKFRNAGVVAGTVNTTTGNDGEYLVHGVSAQSTRMVVTHPNAITRSFPVDVTGNGSQDVTLLPAAYNTTHLRAEMWDAVHTMFWPQDAPPTFVAYRKKYGDSGSVDVDAGDWAAVLDVLYNELPSISEDFYGTAAHVEIFNGRPEDDPRFTQAGDWGYINGSNCVSVAVRDTFSGGAAGLGGCMYTGQYVLTGGGAVTMTGGGGYADLRHVVRHEIGHALAWAHPFDHLDPASPYMRDSLMNYWNVGHWANEYTDADKECMRIMQHRAPGNVDPDYDPDGFVGFKGEGPSYGGVYVDRADDSERIDFEIRDGQLVWNSDPGPLGIH